MITLESSTELMDYAGLLVTPVLAVLMAAMLAKHPVRWRNAAYYTALIIVLTVGLGILFSVDFWSPLLSSLTFLLAYASYGFLAVSCLTSRMRVLGVLLGIPLVIGVLAGIIGSLGFVFFDGNHGVLSSQDKVLSSGLVCEDIEWSDGSTVPDDGWKNMVVYRKLPLGLRQQMWSRLLDEKKSVDVATQAAIDQCLE